jgi:hypothetical protein
MNPQLSERTRHQLYLFSILLSALTVRVLVGLGKPSLDLERSVLVGLTTVVFLSPALYRAIHGDELLTTVPKRVCHAISMLLAGGLFLYYIALG